MYDKTGFLYEIPNYCIHWPSEYIENKVEKPVSKKLKIKFQHLGTTIMAQFNNYSKVGLVKEHLAREYKLESKDRIRLFYRGREMIDSREVWEYQVEDEHTITVQVKA